MLISYLSYSSTLMMEVIHPFETPVDFQWNTARIPEDRTLRYFKHLRSTVFATYYILSNILLITFLIICGNI